MSLQWMAKFLPCVVVLCLAAGQARGGVLFDGESIGYQYLFPTQTSVFFSDDLTVGAGDELAFVYPGGTFASLDISDTRIEIQLNALIQFSAAPFNGLRIFDRYNVLPAFGQATVNAATNLSGFSQANVSFNENNIFINWQGLRFGSQTLVSIDVAPTSPVIGVPGPIVAAVVPEPASLAVFGMAALGMAVGSVGRRRQSPG